LEGEVLPKGGEGTHEEGLNQPVERNFKKHKAGKKKINDPKKKKKKQSGKKLLHQCFVWECLKVGKKPTEYHGDTNTKRSIVRRGLTKIRGRMMRPKLRGTRQAPRKKKN